MGVFITKSSGYAHKAVIYAQKAKKLAEAAAALQAELNEINETRIAKTSIVLDTRDDMEGRLNDKHMSTTDKSSNAFNVLIETYQTGVDALREAAQEAAEIAKKYEVLAEG
ncbi:MAG: hypothetical protein LBB49_04420 [Gracilibacteraceae bacterium]|nr:hypothetical protein [Gracilibacteraceae bacterium]